MKLEFKVSVELIEYSGNADELRNEVQSQIETLLDKLMDAGKLEDYDYGSLKITHEGM